MGNWFSKNDASKTEQKVGTVNNGNIVIHESLPVHNDEAIILIYLIAALIIIKVVLKLRKAYNRRLERHFTRRSIYNLSAIPGSPATPAAATTQL